MKNKAYHTVGTVPNYRRKTKHTKLSELFQITGEKQSIPHCRNCSKLQEKNKAYHTVGTVPNYRRKTNVERDKMDALSTRILTFLAWYAT